MPSNTAARIGPIEGIPQSSFPGRMLLTLRQQIPPHLLPQASQRVELLIVKFRSPVALPGSC